MSLDAASELDFLLFQQDGVLCRAQALRFLSRDAILHRVSSGRWVTVHPGVYVTHAGPRTREQQRWIAVLAAGVGGRQAEGAPAGAHPDGSR